MMTIATRDFGEKEIDESSVFDFPNGVFAFEDDRRFALLSPLGEDTYPMWLQSLDHTELCFIVFDPERIDESFNVTLNESEKRLLQVKTGDPIRSLTIAKIPEDYRRTTVNMKSPIVINPETRTALQVILPHDYPFRYPLFPEEVK
ncbi:MAG: flagellar assembly protein FliW [Bacteroides sp.]|nr:flagellar assembly protein FliW [Eubacterium sp.]MCM1418542.1 flagellar assembly protein FliW [Roseburia sp.]MCM1462576.1 flagellar assembly protein FliW [Bacteroides sp.]